MYTHTYIYKVIHWSSCSSKHVQPSQRDVAATFLSSSPNSKERSAEKKRRALLGGGGGRQHVLEISLGLHQPLPSSSLAVSCSRGANAAWDLSCIAWSISSPRCRRWALGSQPDLWRWCQLLDCDSRYGSMAPSDLLLPALLFTILVIWPCLKIVSLLFF